MQIQEQQLIDTLVHMLTLFKDEFSRAGAFANFARICLGFMLRSDLKGVTDFVRIGYEDDEDPDALYQRIIKFFRASSFSLSDLRDAWCGFLSSLDEQVPSIDGRRILIGDGVKQGKAGLYMAAVKRYAQSSESVAKPDVIWGHLWGFLGLLTGDSGGKMFCTPINADIQDGNQILKSWEDDAYAPQTHVMQMVNAGIAYFKNSHRSHFLALDRYFLSGELIKSVDNANKEQKDNTSLCIITKAKRNCIVYEKVEPQQQDARKPGRPRRKGISIRLNEFFVSRSGEFQEAEMFLYGKMQKVRYLALDYLWGMGYYREMRFVLVEMNGTRAILVSPDTSIPAQTIITVYTTRWKCLFRNSELFRKAA